MLERLLLGFVTNFFDTLGIGSFAPTTAAFRARRRQHPLPQARRYDRVAAIGLALGGIPGVLLAAFLVKSLPLDAVRVLVVIVIGYTAATLWADARRETAPVRPPSPSVADMG